MEMLEERIKQFMTVPENGDGSGDGFGSGDGDGDGSGSGSGDGSGDGFGFGDGSGSGDGDGFGFGDLKTFNRQRVYYVDGLPTLIDAICGNYAKGRIVNADFTTSDCYIAKEGSSFAHGKTLRAAFQALRDKAMEALPIEERINRFKAEFPDPTAKIPARRLYEWHHVLTGSCEMGRTQFARDHGIDIDTDMFTVREFVELTKNSYGGKVIRMLV